jgi:hypothetical protein
MGIRCTNARCEALNEDGANVCGRCGTTLPALAISGEGIKVPSSGLFMALQWGGFLACFAGGAVSGFQGKDTGQPIIFLGFLLLIAANIYALVVVYRCWSAIQDGTTDVTPGAAIARLFLPLYNVYWIFVTYKRLATETQTYLREKTSGIASPISGGLSVTYCILTLLSFIPGLGVLAALVNMIVVSVLIFQWTAFLRLVSQPISSPSREGDRELPTSLAGRGV